MGLYDIPRLNSGSNIIVSYTEPNILTEGMFWFRPNGSPPPPPPDDDLLGPLVTYDFEDATTGAFTLSGDASIVDTWSKSGSHSVELRGAVGGNAQGGAAVKLQPNPGSGSIQASVWFRYNRTPSANAGVTAITPLGFGWPQNCWWASILLNGDDGLLLAAYQATNIPFIVGEDQYILSSNTDYKVTALVNLSTQSIEWSLYDSDEVLIGTQVDDRPKGWGSDNLYVEADVWGETESFTMNIDLLGATE